MSDLVPDASVALMLLFPESMTAQALTLFRDTQSFGDSLVAPHLLPIEVTNGIRRHMRRERLSLSDALAQLDDFLALPITLVTDDDLHREALRLTSAFSLGAHDAHYVALAQRLGCEFWTADEKLLRAIGGRLPLVRFLGDYTSPSDRD